jgi:hypothetical protein
MMIETSMVQVSMVSGQLCAAVESETARLISRSNTSEDRAAVKRNRSPSPYDHDEAYRAWAAKRARSREEYGASPAYAGALSPPRSRNWDELDREEKEREWARYEREQEWERYRAREYEADAADPYRDREASYRAEYDERHRE